MADLGRLAAQRVRRLRLERGWSARELAEACRREGMPSLTRSTIAKIESGVRGVTAGEIPVLARALGVTTADLLETTGPQIFLGFADEDAELAGAIADWLTIEGFQVHNWRNPELVGGEFIKQTESGPGSDDAFLVLISPNYLKSPWFLREREPAIQREQTLRARDPGAAFIYALEIGETPVADAGYLANYDWMNLNTLSKIDEPLGELVRRLSSLGQPPSQDRPYPFSYQLETGRPSLPLNGHPDAVFRDREEELEKVLRGLTNLTGPHFWLIIAPPQLGKTWFLQRIAMDPALTERPWVTRLVDLSEQPPSVRADPAALLGLLLGEASQDATRQVEPLGVAREIIKSRRPHLFMLDSADLLEDKTAAALRSALSQVYRFVLEAGPSDVRLALIVASRREGPWRGITPAPRLSPLPLAQFGVDVIQQSVNYLAQDMGRYFDAESIRNFATLVYDVTEGLPTLLVSCLDWIREEEWLSIDRLRTQELFDQIADPYIETRLLTRASLIPRSQEEVEKPLRALTEAYRVLAPNRLFTQSHLRHYLELDSRFNNAVIDAGWSMADLWQAISGTSLLAQPLNEPWQEVQGAIRRLLYRYFYRSAERQADAHREALNFFKIWADRQVGTEQIVGLVECLWHEAMVIGIREPTHMNLGLIKSAQDLSLTLKASSAYTLDELRSYAVQRMRDDEELQEAVSSTDGLFDRLIGAVLRPEEA